MWNNSSNWNFWPMQPTAYNNVPPDQIDWASLAKQWIANREMMGIGLDYPQPGSAPPPPFPPAKPAPPMGSLGEMSSVVGGNMMAQPQPQSIICDMENSNSQDSNYYQHSEPEQAPTEGWNNWNQGGMPAWAVPPPPPPAEEVQENAVTDVPYSSNANQYTSSFGFNQPSEEMYLGPYEHSGYQQFWGQGPMAAQQMMSQKPFTPGQENLEYRAPPKRGANRASWPTVTDIPPLMDDSGIDAAKRRQLPLWIREGLEKMEREKQRLVEKERQEQAMQLAKKAKEEAEKDNHSANADQSGPVVVKSIFDSDDEDGTAETKDTRVMPTASNTSITVEQKKSPSVEEEEEEEPAMSEEDKEAAMMLKMRQMLTEVLLAVTNSEIEDVASSVYSSAKRKQAKAPARQLAKSSALASITSLGLGYGSDSSDEDNEERLSPDGKSDESEDEAVLHEKIRKKKAEFERKMRDMEEKEREREMEKKRLSEEQSKSQKKPWGADSADEAEIAVAEVKDVASKGGDDRETIVKRSRSNDGKKTGHSDKKVKEKQSEEINNARSRDGRKKQEKREKQKVEEEEEEEDESSESESESTSESTTSSGSGSSNESSSSNTQESRKSDQKEIKMGMHRERVKSQMSDGAKVIKKEKEEPKRRRTDEDDRTGRLSWQESGTSRKEREREGQKNEEREVEQKRSKKKRSRHNSDEIEEIEEHKRRHISRDDHRHSRHQANEPKVKHHHAQRVEDSDESSQYKSSSRSHRSREHRTRSDCVDSYDKHDSLLDYSTRTYDYDDEVRDAKSRHKKSKHSGSSSLSSRERRRSRQSPDMSSGRRRSAKDHQSSSDRDRERRKDAKDKSGKKERAKHRSRSRSRSDDY